MPQPLLVRREIDLEVVDEPELPLVAQVERLADDAPADDVGGLHAEGAGEMCVGRLASGFLDRAAADWKREGT